MIQILKFHFWLVDNRQSFLPNSFLYRISQIFVDIFAKNMKGWSEKSKILCIEQLGRAEKKLQNKKFPNPALLCANISQIFFSHLDIRKYLLLFFLRVGSTGPLTLSHPSSSLSEFQLILVKIIVLLRWGFNSYQYLKESETDKICSPKYFYLK